MKKTTTVLCLSFFLCLSVFSQTENDSHCDSVLKEILHVHRLKVKYEAAQKLYPAIKDKNSYFYYMLSQKHRVELLKLIVDNPDSFPEFEEIEKGSAETGHVLVRKVSDKEKEWFIAQLTKTLDDYFTDYQSSIATIKSKKEIYLQCIEEEFAKGELSEYKQKKLIYNYNPPMRSVLLPIITKFDFLRIFKDFIFSEDESLLPDSDKVSAYLR
ncbi:MAG: hypothetical protein ACOYEG_07590 [Petrimonas sp.]|jgi:hypothetical protein